MKWFLLLIMAAAAVTIFMFRDELRGKIDSSTTISPNETPDEVVSTGEPTPGGTSTMGSSGKPTRTNGSKPSAGNTPPVKPPKTTITQKTPSASDAERRYPMPKFITIEQAVGDWKQIPTTAFPRQVKITKPLKIVLPGGVGSSTLPANSDVYALAARNGMLTVGKTRNASARGLISIDDTDYKKTLSLEFELWKQNQKLKVLKQRARYLNVVAKAKAAEDAILAQPGAANVNYEKELGRKPKQNADGTVPLMLASLERGDVTEIKPGIIVRWGPVIREVVDGEAYWTSTVDYKTVSLFGELSTEAQALMKFGKVLKWVYTGSGESVP